MKEKQAFAFPTPKSWEKACEIVKAVDEVNSLENYGFLTKAQRAIWGARRYRKFPNKLLEDSAWKRHKIYAPVLLHSVENAPDRETEYTLFEAYCAITSGEQP